MFDCSWAAALPNRSGSTGLTGFSPRTAKVVRKLSLNWGVTPLLAEGAQADGDMLAFGMRRGRELGYIRRGDVVVATAGISRKTGSTNMIRVIEADE